MKRIATMFMLLFSLAFLMVATPASAQINSNTATVALNVNLSESLSLSCTPGSITFTGTGGGSVPASGPISCTTTWNLLSSRTSLTVYEYFTSNHPLTGVSNVTPDFFWAVVNGGTSTAFSATSATNAGVTGYFGPNLYYQGTIGTNQPSGNHTDTVQLTLTGANNIAPGTYSGTLSIVAVVV